MKDRIRQIRESHNLSQVAFGERIGRSAGHISNLGKKYAEASDETIRRIVDTYNVDETWLRTGKGDMFSGAAPVAMRLNIGERIKKVRKEMKLTQSEFADLVGCHKNQVHYVEIGKIKASDEFLCKVGRACDLKYRWLTTGEGEMKGFQVYRVDQELIDWLNEHPEIILELQQRSGMV